MFPPEFYFTIEEGTKVFHANLNWETNKFHITCESDNEINCHYKFTEVIEFVSMRKWKIKWS
jgi:hypothetical protein